MQRELQTVTRWATAKRLFGPVVSEPLLRALRRTQLRAGLAVYYHGVGDQQGEPHRELLPLMGRALFAQQLAWMHARFELVQTSELLAAIERRGPGAPFPLAVTFDDDLACHRERLMPILAASSAPGTFFVSGASLGRPAWFWWEALDARGGDVHAEAARLLRRDSPRPTVATATEAIALPRASRPRGMRGADVATLARAGHEIGFHTRRPRAPSRAERRGSLDAMMSEGREQIADWAVGRLRPSRIPTVAGTACRRRRTPSRLRNRLHDRSASGLSC